MRVKFLNLNSSEKKQIYAIAEEGIHSIRHNTNENLKDFISQATIKLPKRIKVYLDHLKELKYEILIIKLLDPKNYEKISTPISHRSAIQNYNLTTMDISHALIAFYLGEPMGYKIQQNGRLINDIIPLEEEKNRVAASTSTQVGFHFHTEDAFLINPPSFICLTCIRNLEKAITRLGYFDLEIMPKKYIEALQKPVYFINSNALQMVETGDDVLKPVIFVEEKNLAVRYNYDRINGNLKDIELDALKFLDTLLKNNATEFVFRSGFSYLINNKKVAHARDKYSSDFSGKKRWLLRSVIQ